MKNYVSHRIKRVETQLGTSDIKKYLDAFRFDCQLRNLTNKTLDCYYERLGYLFKYLENRQIPFVEVDRRLIQDFILLTKDSVSDETINGRIRVYRRFFNFLIEDGLWEGSNPMKGIQLLKTVKRVKPVIEIEDIQKILSSIPVKPFENARNRVMVLLFWDGMLRLNEVRNLKLSDVDLEGRLIKVFGKGRKERMVPLGVKTLKAIQQFLIKWRSKYSGENLICMRNGQAIKERHYHKIIQQLGEKSGLKLHPHLLRHSAATWYIRQGGNPVILQKILGHSSLSVTQKYLHLSNEDAVNSYNDFSPSNGLRL